MHDLQRKDLILAISATLTASRALPPSKRARAILTAIEAAGAIVVPAVLTADMRIALWDPIDMAWTRRCEKAIAASPFRASVSGEAA